MEQIKPIRNEADYEAALEIVSKYFDAQPGTPEGDLVEVYAVLIENYENKHFPVPLPDPIEAILYHLESRGLDRKYLERFIGTRARVSEILNKKRPLSMEMIRRLHDGLGIPLDILLQKYMDEPKSSDEEGAVSILIAQDMLENKLENKLDKWVFAPSQPIAKFPDRRKPVQRSSSKQNQKLAMRATVQ